MNIKKDQIVNAICLFAIIFTLCLIISICLKVFFNSDINVAFVKDIFSIGSTIYVGLLAICLYSDWREQHNKNIISSTAIEIWKTHSSLHDRYLNENKKYLSGGRCDITDSGEFKEIFLLSRELLKFSEKAIGELESNLILLLMLTANSELEKYFYRKQLSSVHFSEKEKYIDENIIFHDFMIKFI